MTYKISDVAAKLGTTVPTLHYYDQKGLLPFVDRDQNGARVFKDSDFKWLHIIECLKKTGMPLREIKVYIDWCMEGDSRIKERHDMIHEQRKNVEAQIKELNDALNTIDYKCWYYETALNAGTTNIHKNRNTENLPENIKLLIEKIGENFV